MINSLFIWFLTAVAKHVDKTLLNAYHVTGFAQRTTYSITYYATDGIGQGYTVLASFPERRGILDYGRIVILLN